MARPTLEDEPETPRATPAMLAAAYAADMREAYPHHHDDEQAEFAHRSAGAGFIEIQLAHD